MRKLSVLFIVPYPSEGASNRLRVEQYIPYLEKEGIRYHIRPFISRRFYKILFIKGHPLAKAFYFSIALLNRFFDILRALSYDIIFIHREALPIGSILIERIFSKLKKKIIFDFDDAIFLPSTSRSNNYIERFKNPGKVSKIIALSNSVIVGNRYLEEYARKFSKNVVIIPTPIDTEKYAAEPKKVTSAEVTIGWIGSFTTRVYLEDIRDVLKSLKEKYNNLKLKFVGNWADLEKPIEGAEYKEWSLKEELADMRSFDMGIMPMPDDMWTKGKCAFKIILYMACGIPVVSSPVGMNREIINEGENGFFANSKKEWTDRLSALIENRPLRMKIGEAGVSTVRKNYSVAHTAPKFIEVLKRTHKMNKGETK